MFQKLRGILKVKYTLDEHLIYKIKQYACRFVWSSISSCLYRLVLKLSVYYSGFKLVIFFKECPKDSSVSRQTLVNILSYLAVLPASFSTQKIITGQDNHH